MLSKAEASFEDVKEKPEWYMMLESGKLFKIDGDYSYTSADSAKTWERGGKVNPLSKGMIGDLYCMMGDLMNYLSIQITGGEYAGRIVAPYYLEMTGDHKDYTRERMGGYAIWQGERTLIETHTYVPEMAGSFMRFSDDEGKTWQTSKGFLMGYFNDGHLGHWSCEEPTVVELKDGRLLCYMRSTTGRLLKSYSSDGGVYWSKVEATDIACSNSPAVLKKIPGTNDLVMVWNQVSEDEIKAGYRRGRLCLAISKNNGDSWINYKTLELVKGLNTVKYILPGELKPMVRGPREKGPLLDDYFDAHYPNIHFQDDTIFVCYYIARINGKSVLRIRKYPVSSLYDDAE